MKIQKFASAALLTAAVSVAGAGFANTAHAEEATTAPADTAAVAVADPAEDTTPVEPTTPATEEPATETPAEPATPEAPAQGGSSTAGADAFSSQISPDNVTNFFGKAVDLVAAILGFVGKVV
ncbi:hypothetical protein [Corynebacterium gerontici]|uniref:Secreted protein n=1 Tax=Corynebacterium gerontici TaxID=2079234 RepID=A0A3G6J8G0_9CORY|nr:hypothetical protein [Corynebacterium gerontici]AZA12314.1 hypothetical protein CGERO_10145 [Corynebacterium gerontici]